MTDYGGRRDDWRIDFGVSEVKAACEMEDGYGLHKDLGTVKGPKIVEIFRENSRHIWKIVGASNHQWLYRKSRLRAWRFGEDAKRAPKLDHLQHLYKLIQDLQHRLICQIIPLLVSCLCTGCSSGVQARDWQQGGWLVFSASVAGGSSAACNNTSITSEELLKIIDCPDEKL
ncbi:hypothetical protein TorRG33x02_228170 [Trema orientale]|uniref:Uncharacterized protein n=1 Tax=Trema orientale TaxID=63057 RepID=A0A2P5E768_TREOI|nr:hypothetical protein TorRG33x02_228170 [Trema orientale]